MSGHEVIRELLDGLPAVLRQQVDHIHVWPEVVIRKLVAKTSRVFLGGPGGPPAEADCVFGVWSDRESLIGC